MSKELGESLKDSLTSQFDCFERELKKISLEHGKQNLSAMFLVCFRKMFDKYRKFSTVELIESIDKVKEIIEIIQISRNELVELLEDIHVKERV